MVVKSSNVLLVSAIRCDSRKTIFVSGASNIVFLNVLVELCYNFVINLIMCSALYILYKFPMSIDKQYSHDYFRYMLHSS